MGSVSLDLVASDWDSSGWGDAYFPDDLPADWRLAYYANEFPSVLLPHSRWAAADGRQLREWLADTPESFRFYLELPVAGPPEIPGRCRRLLGARLRGALLRAPLRGCTPVRPDGVPLYCLTGHGGAKPPAPWLPAVAPPNRDPGDLRAAGQWLTEVARSFDKGPVLVVLDGARFAAEDLRRWWQLVWLIGLA